MFTIIHDISTYDGFKRIPPWWYYHWCITGETRVINDEVEKYGMQIFPWYATSGDCHPEWATAPVRHGVFSVFDKTGSDEPFLTYVFRNRRSIYEMLVQIDRTKS